MRRKLLLQRARNLSRRAGLSPPPLGLHRLKKVSLSAGAALPWTAAIRDAETFKAVPLILKPESGEVRSVLVNCAPVLDGWDRPKGAIATFNDVTELEEKSRELAEALAEVEKRRSEIELQNEELEVLATRDPLTGVSNRRSFLEAFSLQFAEAKREGKELCCIMADIDHFKKVNDTHGHAMGDEVIKRVSSDVSTGSHRSNEQDRSW